MSTIGKKHNLERWGRIESWKRGIIAAAMVASLLSIGAPAIPVEAATDDEGFRRVSTFTVASNNDDATAETVAEIVSATEDGTLLAYTDGEGDAIGFVDIADPANPTPAGTLDVGGEPTSIVIWGNRALVGINTSESFTEPSGALLVVDLPVGGQVPTIRQALPLGGQPDSVALSLDTAYAAIVIENERDEDLGDGELPQAPAGELIIADLNRNGTVDRLRTVDLTGLASYGSDDPEPEFVDINWRNEAFVSLQENNYVAIVDLLSGSVTGGFEAGTVDLDHVDAVEDDSIILADSISDVPREPDALTFLPDLLIATANEGDLFGGSRGFTIFDYDGNVMYDSGSSFDHLAVRHGHYPEGRSENKGSEPEAIEWGRYGDDDLLFVGSERGSFVAVYELDGAVPTFDQFLPTGLGPEGLLAIPHRDLLVVSAEVDDPEFGVRATISIYHRGADPDRPDIVSVDDANGLPTPWGALSGMVADPEVPGTAYAVSDSFYADNAIFRIDVSTNPATIARETVLTLGGEPVSYDPEGISLRSDGGFWIVSEGGVSVDADDPADFSYGQNLLLAVGPDGAVLDEIGLPEAVVECRAATIEITDGSISRGMRRDLRFGFEGVTEDADGLVHVATQRGWNYADVTVSTADGEVSCADLSNPEDTTSIWTYDPADDTWTEGYYLLEEKPEQASWVGLSEITALEDGSVLVIERDNRTGDFAEIKTVVKVDLETGDGLILDILPAMRECNCWVSDKPESLAVIDGELFVVTDNDGVDDWSGETQLLRLGPLSDLGL